MAEDEYREYKESDGSEPAHFRAFNTASLTPSRREGRFTTSIGAVKLTRSRGGAVRLTHSARVFEAKRLEVRQRPATGGDYAAFKATIGAAANDIKEEIRDQHQETTAEVQPSRHDILAAIKASPAVCVKLISEFGSLFLLFSLALRFTLKIELVNTAFAVFMLFAFGLYWSMASLKQYSSRRRDYSNRER
jgi:hypothetical protein